jgi:hypothetical protein
MSKNFFSWVERWFKPQDIYLLDRHQQSNLLPVNLTGLDNLPTGENNVRREFLRQARWSFNFAILMMSASSVISIAGIVFLLSGKVKEGTVTAAGGLASYIVPANCLRFAEKANDRLNKTLGGSEQEK